MHPVLALQLLLGCANALLLPEPNGSYHVASQVQSLTDASRMDPYAPADAPHLRRVLVSIFWPIGGNNACPIEACPYMPPKTAQVYGLTAAAMGLSNDTFANFELGFCKSTKHSPCSPSSKPAEHPLAIFSPGAGNSRLLYSAMAKSLSSRGYVVVTVDHPYDANIVEFPDGSVITGADNEENTTSLEKATKVRGQDLSFVLSYLKGAQSRPKILQDLPGRINFDKVVAYGHSLGGASAAEAILLDPRILGGADLDGQIFNDALSRGLSRSFFLLGRPDHRKEDNSWVTFWNNLTGPKIEAQVEGSLHGSFTDLPLLLRSLDLPAQYESAIRSLVGTVDGIELVTETVASFFEFVFTGSTTRIMKLLETSSELSLVDEEL